MHVDETTVRRIARLARIKITDDEAKSLEGELSGILNWVEQLDEIDTTDVEPMTRVVAQELKKRPDKVTDGEIADDVVKNAPDGGGSLLRRAEGGGIGCSGSCNRQDDSPLSDEGPGEAERLGNVQDIRTAGDRAHCDRPSACSLVPATREATGARSLSRKPLSARRPHRHEGPRIRRAGQRAALDPVRAREPLLFAPHLSREQGAG